ncbi:hypothetical protein EJ06DRAFT_390379 [Trichodelitschia bisporula]|uniref:Uncharacterized protein n=1 Tax=Trichodelitschia bisporula TaxID=703511 RepID=A0A6G1HZB2_9PEZI|nr:hypothetical protein EJ06DRAFT_390379 [Trichodelitschia bisporula]
MVVVMDMQISGPCWLDLIIQMVNPAKLYSNKNDECVDIFPDFMVRRMGSELGEVANLTMVVLSCGGDASASLSRLDPSWPMHHHAPTSMRLALPSTPSKSINISPPRSLCHRSTQSSLTAPSTQHVPARMSKKHRHSTFTHRHDSFLSPG